MNGKVEILSIKKNEICLRKKRSLKRFYIVSAILISCFLLVFSSSSGVFENLKESIMKVYSPVSSLYNDNSESVFTNGDIIEKDSPNLILPIKGATYEILSNGTIEFLVSSSIMITACDSGVVLDAGVSLDGIKFVKISHKNGVVSLIENMDIMGVKKGDIVKSGQDIATASLGQKLYLKIFQNDSQITNLKINKSKIIWEN